jgi:hypothetical protein
VYVRDLAAGTTVLVDRQAVGGEPGTGEATGPEMDGAANRIVFFASQPLTAELTSPGGALYVRDLATGTTLLAGRGNGPDGVAATVSDDAYAISDDGLRVSFNGSGAELPGAPQISQIYVRDLAANTTTLASAADGTATTPANGSTFRSSLSGNGGCLAFATSADNLTTPGYLTRDFSQVYLRAVSGECPVLGTTGSTTSTTLSPTSTTSTTLPPASTGRPISARVVVLRPGRLVKLVAKGLSTLPADPALGDGTLEVRGTTGAVSYVLPASGWKRIGRRAPKGFKFEGGACRVSLLRRRITAVCRGDTGSLSLPEPGPLAAVLTVGAGRAAYCAECGGRSVGKASRLFKRKRCLAPATCP